MLEHNEFTVAAMVKAARDGLSDLELELRRAEGRLEFVMYARGYSPGDIQAARHRVDDLRRRVAAEQTGKETTPMKVKYPIKCGRLKLNDPKALKGDKAIEKWFAKRDRMIVEMSGGKAPKKPAEIGAIFGITPAKVGAIKRRAKKAA